MSRPDTSSGSCRQALDTGEKPAGGAAVPAADPAGRARLSSAAARRGQALLIRYLIGGSVINALVTSLAALFLLSLGAAPFHLGVLATVSQVDKVMRLAGVPLMGRLGKARLLALGRALSGAATAGLVAVALSCGAQSDGGRAGIWLALVGLAARGLLLHTGNTAWWPLVQDNTSGSAVGSFITRMRVPQRLIEIGLPLAVGWYLGTQPAPARFAPLFAGAVLAALLSAWWARGVPERAPAPADQGLWQRLRQVVAVPAIRRYSSYLMVRTFLRFAAFPFFVVVLTGRGLPFSQAVWLTSLMALGQILSLYFWGRLVDAHGTRPAISLSLLLVFCAWPAWLFVPGGGLPLLLWAALYYLGYGVAEAGLQMGHTRAMMGVVPEQYQGEGFAVVIYAAAFGGGVGGLVGGAAFEWVAQLEAGTRFEPALVYLAALQAGVVLQWLMSRRLHGYADEPSLYRLATCRVRWAR